MHQLGAEIENTKLHQLGAELGIEKLHQAGGETENLKLQQPVGEFKKHRERMKLLQKELRETKRLMKSNK